MISIALLGITSAVFSNSAFFSPYADLTINTHWDPQTQDMQPMDLSVIASDQKISGFHLAFITDSGVCQPAWGGQAAYSVTEQWGKKLADKLANNKVSIGVSFGGATGTDLSMNCNDAQLKAIFQHTVTVYHAQSLDFDLENGTADVAKLIRAIKAFQQEFPAIEISFTLPVMPEGLTFSGKQILEAAKTENLQYKVNIMAMDYGPAYDASMGDYAIEAATSVHQDLASLYPDYSAERLWSLIKVTPMIGVNDVNAEQFTLQDADKLKQFATQKQLGGISMWSVARDKPCADLWASPVCSGNKLQETDYQFMQHLR